MSQNKGSNRAAVFFFAVCLLLSGLSEHLAVI